MAARSVMRITLPAAAIRREKCFRFTECDCIRLIRFQLLCIVAADLQGKLTERWGRKASGLRAWAPRTAGLPASDVKRSRRPGPCPVPDQSQPQSRFPPPLGTIRSLVSPRTDWTIPKPIHSARQSPASVTPAAFTGAVMPVPSGPGQHVSDLTFYLTFHCYIVAFKFILRGRFRL